MITTNLRRMAAAALAAGAILTVIVTATAAQAEGDFQGFDRPANTQPARTTPASTTPNSGIPGFRNPLAPKTTAAPSARRLFVGTWKVLLKNGKTIAVRFTAKGRFFLIHSDRRQVIEVGFWKVQNKRLVMLPVGACQRTNMKKCRKFEQRKHVRVAFRIINRNRIDAPAGTFIRRA